MKCDAKHLLVFQMFHSDKHFPSSFLSNNKSLRDMFKDPDEYDRRMASLSQRNEESQRSLESRNARIKDVVDRKSKVFGQDPISSISRSRDSSVSREITRSSAALSRYPDMYGSSNRLRSAVDFTTIFPNRLYLSTALCWENCKSPKIIP